MSAVPCYTGTIGMFTLAFYYVRWHYSQALRDLLNIVGNFVWFFYEFFSIPLLMKTFFVPFHRLEDDRKKRNMLDFGAIAEGIIVSLLMRIVGVIVRTTLIVMGITFIVLSIVFGACMLVIWLCAPLFLVFIVLSALTLIAVG